MMKYSQARIAIATLQLDSLTDFYTKLLQQSPHPYQPQKYAEFQLNGLRLGIFQVKLERWEEFRNAEQSRISLCLEVEDLYQAITHLTQLGYPPPSSVIKASHGLEIYAYDPDGNRIILHQTC